MEKDKLVLVLSELFPSAEINTTGETILLKADAAAWHETALGLRNDERLLLDYLYNLYAIDWQKHFTLVCNLESTILGHSVTVKLDIADHDKPAIDTVSDIWITAEFQEREIYDLMGIAFNNHPDPRRLFLDDGWGFPLRKDYKDDINFIER